MLANGLGVSSRHAIIWRAPDASGIDWVEAFPPGYACGRCVPEGPGEAHDSFEPVECGDVELLFKDGLSSDELCDWT